MNPHFTPIPGVSGRPATAADRANPVLVICALAWKGNPLLARDSTEHDARRVLESTFQRHSRDEILSWRKNFIASEQQNRWRVAKRWAVDLLRVPGAEHLSDNPCPDEHQPPAPRRPRGSGSVGS